MEDEDDAMRTHATRPDLMTVDVICDDGESEKEGSGSEDVDEGGEENLRIMTPPASSDFDNSDHAGGDGGSDNDCGSLSKAVSVHRL